MSVSTRRVEQLKTEGVIKGQGKPTKYDLLPTIQAYIRYLSDKANGREKKETTAELEEAKLRAEVDIKEAKAKGRTVLIMAHRPAAIQECDLIMVLNDGAPVAFGPRDQVLREMVKNAGEIARAVTPGGVA